MVHLIEMNILTHHVVIISTMKARIESDIPTTRIKKAAAKSTKFKDLVFVSGGLSVPHWFVDGRWRNL